MLWEDAKEYFSAYHRDMTEELDYALKLRHWEDDYGQTRDRRRLQPKGIELYNLIRHKTGQILKAPDFLEARPVDNVTDPVRADIAKAVVEHILYDPGRRFPAHLERLVVGALSARYWAMEWFYDPNDGPFGEINFETIDPRRFFWAPGYYDCMESRCPWTIKHVPMTLEQIQGMKDAGWKNIDKLKAEDVIGADRVPAHPFDTIRFNGGGRAGPGHTTTPIVHVLFCRFRRDNAKRKTVRDPFRPLPPPQRYMACANCSFRTTTHPRDEDGKLPAKGQPCPACGQAMLERVDYERIEDDILAYPDGRLSIIAPFQDVVLYDDAWPEKLRGFPQATYDAYIHPAEPVGMSDTYLNWDLQSVSNAMLRLGYEQMSESRGVLVVDEDGIVDAHGEPYTFSDANGRIAYRTTEGSGVPLQFFQPQGLNAAWSTYFQAIQGVFRSNLGSSDLGLTPQSSKDIPVGTVNALVASGEVPVDHHIFKLRLFKTYMANNLLDMARSTWTEARFVRTFGPAGEQMMKMLRGSDIPAADVRFHADPTLRQLKVDEAKTYMEIANLPPARRKFVGKGVGVSAIALQELERDEAMQAQAMAAQNPRINPGNNGVAVRPDAVGPGLLR